MRILNVRVPNVVHLLIASRSIGSTAVFSAAMIVMILDQVLYYQIGLLPGHFYYMLIAHDSKGFLYYLLLAVIFFIIGAATTALSEYCCQVVGLLLRRSLTCRIFRNYFEAEVVWKLSNRAAGDQDKALDNYDQRVSRDVELWSESIAVLLSQTLSLPAICIIYSILVFWKLGFIALLLIYIFFLVGALVSKIFVLITTKFVTVQERREGNYRFAHTILRSNAEEITFHNSGQIEKLNLMALFRRVLLGKFGLINAECAQDLSASFFMYMGSSLNYVILAINLFVISSPLSSLDEASLARSISQDSFICLNLISSFTTLLSNTKTFSLMSGYSKRIVDVIIEMDRTIGNVKVFEKEKSKVQSEGYRIVPDFHINGENMEEFDRNFGVIDPDQLQLQEDEEIKNLFFDASTIQNWAGVLVEGDCGSGKSTLVRALRGLYPGGDYKTVNKDDVLFVTQKPYIPPSLENLGEILAFSSGELGELQNLNVIEAISFLVESGFTTRFDSKERVSIASLGEKEKILLAMARVLCIKPRHVVIEDVPLLFESHTIERFYSLLKENGVPFTTFMNGSNSIIRSHHEKVMNISQDGRLVEVIPK